MCRKLRYIDMQMKSRLNPKTSKERVISNPKQLASKTKIPHQAKTPPKKVHACQQHQKLLKVIGMREEMNTNIESELQHSFKYII